MNKNIIGNINLTNQTGKSDKYKIVTGSQDMLRAEKELLVEWDNDKGVISDIKKRVDNSQELISLLGSSEGSGDAGMFNTLHQWYEDNSIPDFKELYFYGGSGVYYNSSITFSSSSFKIKDWITVDGSEADVLWISIERQGSSDMTVSYGDTMLFNVYTNSSGSWVNTTLTLNELLASENGLYGITAKKKWFNISAATGSAWTILLTISLYCNSEFWVYDGSSHSNPDVSDGALAVQANELLNVYTNDSSRFMGMINEKYGTLYSVGYRVIDNKTVPVCEHSEYTLGTAMPSELKLLISC